MGDELSETEPHENPLVPNQKLREMYVAMVEARVLDEHLAGSKLKQATRRLHSTRGEEACRVSTALDLQPGDLVSDSQPGLVMDLLAGVRADLLLRSLRTQANEIKQTPHAGSKQLPWIKDANERLRLAMGAALSFKTLKQQNLIAAYVRQGELSKSEWRSILEIASKLELPIFFVLLPAARRKQKEKRDPGLPARSCGVPAFLVDANDAVALYRVAQEAFGRIRTGGGPVLIDCRAYPLDTSQTDPVSKLRKFLLERKIATPLWLDQAGDGLRRRIEASALSKFGIGKTAGERKVANRKRLH